MGVRARTLLLAALGTLISLKAAVVAHHSVAAEFDGRKWMKLTGTVTKVEWTNPHTFFYVDARDPKTGTIVNWACELGSPNMLVAHGWKRDTLKVGMTVNLRGTLARDGTRKVNARMIVADGVRLTAWPSQVPPP